jgi:nucleotide-binding universal stress UspA family protein
MFKSILVGLDGSEHGLRATRAACAIARQFGSRLHLLTVTRPFKVSPELRRYLEAENLLGEPKYVLDDMTAGIIAAARSIAEEAGVKEVRSEVKEGKPARTLVDYAKQNAIDLIVVGSRGVGEIEATLLGSVSQKVSLLAGCHVLIVKE